MLTVELGFVRYLRNGTFRYEDSLIALTSEKATQPGTDVDGTQIRTFRAAGGEVYNSFTITEKERKGQPSDKVTLKDKGKFHNTFKVDSGKSSFVIEGDTEKPDGNIEDNVDVESALGLDEDGKDEVRQQILIPELRAILLDGLQKQCNG